MILRNAIILISAVLLCSVTFADEDKRVFIPGSSFVDGVPEGGLEQLYEIELWCERVRLYRLANDAVAKGDVDAIKELSAEAENGLMRAVLFSQDVREDKRMTWAFQNNAFSNLFNQVEAELRAYCRSNGIPFCVENDTGN